MNTNDPEKVGGPIPSISFAIALSVSSSKSPGNTSAPILLVQSGTETQIAITGDIDYALTATSSNPTVVATSLSQINPPANLTITGKSETFNTAVVTVTASNTKASASYDLQVSVVPS